MRTAIFSLFSLLLSASLIQTVQAAEELVTLVGGDQVKVLYFEPNASAEAPPLAILISGGSNSEFMARAQFWMGKEMVARGWAIALPVSPGGRHYFVDNAEHFPALIADLRRIHTLRPGRTLLVGISSGGSAALEIAARDPRQYLGVVATPGRLHEDTALSALQGLPIFLRVGEKDDFRWNKRLDQLINRLEAAGARVDAAEVPGAKHIFPLNWDELEPWLQQVQQ